MSMSGTSKEDGAINDSLAGTVSGGVKYERVAVMTGHPLQWDTSAIDAVERFGNLHQWCLSLRNVRLGIDPRGVGLILRNIYEQQPGESLPTDVSDKLAGLGDALEQRVFSKSDKELFDERKDWLIKLIQQVETIDDYSWAELDEAQWWDCLVKGNWDNPEEADWWVETTVECLKRYANQKQTDLEGHDRRLLRLYDRHCCTFFAPFNGSDLLGRLESLLEYEDDRRKYQELLDLYSRLPEDVREPHNGYYWSWQLWNFNLSQGRIINMPLLALWKGRPSSTLWAPRQESRGKGATTASLSPHQAADLLEDVLSQGLEDFFRLALRAHGFNQTAPEFAGYTCYSPVFYFADLANPPASAEEYVDKPDVKPLLDRCLGLVDSPKGASWGAHGNGLAAVRREVIRDDERGTYRSRYLLLPLDSRSGTIQNSKEYVAKEYLGNGLLHVTHNLTFLEFTCADEARDVYASVESSWARQPLWNRILQDLKTSVTRSMGLLSGLGWLDHAQVFDEFRELHVLQRSHIKAKLDEEVKKDEQARKDSAVHRASTHRYLQDEQVVFSPLLLSDGNEKVDSLHDALIAPFPYEHLESQLKKSEDRAKPLQKNVDAVNDLSVTINTVLESTDQQTNARSASWTAVLSVLIGFLALSSLAQFVPGAQLVDNGEELGDYPAWLREVGIDPTELEAVTRDAIIVIVLIALIILLPHLLSWFVNRLPPHPFLFGNRVKKLWVHAESTGAYYLGGFLSQHLPEAGKKDLASLLRVLAGHLGINVSRPTKVIQKTADKGWEKAEETDEKAVGLLCALWEEIERARDGHPNRLGGYLSWPPLRRLWRVLRFQWPTQPAWVTGWLQQARHLRFRNELFVFCPELIPSPRVLCILRYKSGDLEGSMISNQDFGKSLMVVGFEEDEIARLDSWLSESREQISVMSVRQFAEVLKERGVTADPSRRKGKNGGWNGSLIEYGAAEEGQLWPTSRPRRPRALRKR